MKWILAYLALAAGLKIPPKNHTARQYFVVEIDTAESLQPLHDFITYYDKTFAFEHPARGLDDHFVFSVSRDHPYMDFIGNYNADADLPMVRRSDFEDEHDTLVGFPGLRAVHMLKLRQLERRAPVLETRGLKIVDLAQKPAKEVSDRLDINDPLFLQQWHLVNTIYPGNDVNVKQLWYDGIRGNGLTVAIIDDGLDYESPDLKDNFSPEGLWDFNDNNALPKPRLFDDYHGTRCAGEVAAAKNDFCGIGVAYEAKVAGIRILLGSITTEEEAAAMVYGLDHNDIYSCSWGPTDNGRTVAAPEKLVKKAVIKGIQEGRKGKGALYVFASGNGGRVGDQCNFDGYTNSIYSITVGVVDYKGLHPSYSEACTAVMVVTYSSGLGEHIHTTDLHEKCSALHGGTSAAAPLAAGIYALVLQVNPELTWRDVQYVSAVAAVPINEDDGEYQLTAFGQKYSNKYGFGKIDAEILVNTARDWKNVKPQAWHYSDVQVVDKVVVAQIDKALDPVKSTITVTEEQMKVMNLERIEHVTVIVNIESHVRGKLDIRLVSPFGVVSKLAWPRDMDKSNKALVDWKFMSVAHWGETGIGEWRLEVVSLPHNTVKVKDWQLNFFGECIDADKAEKYDLDIDYAKVRRERLSEGTQHTSATKTSQEAAKTSVHTILSSIEKLTSASSSLTHAVLSSSASSQPTPISDETEDHEGANKHHTMEHAGQYFMLLAVLGFIFVLSMMKWHRNQSSSRRRRGDFEFDIIPGEEYSDSEDEPESYELDHRTREDLEREQLYDEFDVGALPDYDDDAFQIGDEDEEPAVKPTLAAETEQNEEARS